MIKNRYKEVTKDNYFESLVKNKIVILLVIVLLILSRNFSRTILNLNEKILILKFLFPALFGAIFFVKRFFKYTEFYKKKFKDSADLIILLLNLIFFTFILWLIVNVFFSYFILFKSERSNIESFKCKISTVMTRNGNKVQYIFKNKKYVTQLNYGSLNIEDLKSKYYVVILSKKSFFGSYVLESCRLDSINSKIVFD